MSASHDIRALAYLAGMRRLKNYRGITADWTPEQFEAARRAEIEAEAEGGMLLGPTLESTKGQMRGRPRK